MWNSLATCHICWKEYVNDGPKLSLNDRINIKSTGTTHLFDEIVDWSSINVNDDLPFCPSCIESVKKTSSLSEVRDSIRKEVKRIVNPFIMNSVRIRKEVRSRYGLFLKSTEKSNCIICYAVVSARDTAQEKMPAQHNIVKTCEKYFQSLISPSLGYEPFCTKCSLKLNKIVDLDQKLEQADANMTQFVDEFSLDCFQRVKSENITFDENVDIPTEDTFTEQMMQTNFTAGNVATSDSPVSGHPSENAERATSSDVETSQMNRNNFPTEIKYGDLPRFNIISSSQKDTPILSRQILPQAGGTISSSNKEFASHSHLVKLSVPLLSLEKSNDKLCSSSLNNLSSNSDAPSLKCSPRINLHPAQLKCNICSKEFQNKGFLLSHKMKCVNFIDISNEDDDDMDISAPTEETNRDVQMKSQTVGKYTVRNRKSMYKPRYHCVSDDTDDDDDSISDDTDDDDDTVRNRKRMLKPIYYSDDENDGNVEDDTDDDDDSDYDDYHNPITVNRKSRRGQLRKKSRISGKHFKSNSFNCKYCPAKPTSGRALFLHNQTHSDVAVDTRCEICKNVYSNKRNLHTHMQYQHYLRY